MPFVDTPLTREVLEAVAARWSVSVTGEPQRLHGGEESAAYRIGDIVVRIGPAWRRAAEAEWCHSVAQCAAQQVPEAISPLTAADGATVAVVDRRPISVWPFVDGVGVDDDDESQWRQAADLLARLHRALARAELGPRPAAAHRLPGAVGTEDRDLDAWLHDFDARARARHPLHGDYYAGNILARDARIVGLLDWDEALLGPPERELAWAAWEFGDGLWAESLDDAHEFMAAYREAGGPAGEVDDTTLRQLVRQRLRAELEYVAWQRARGAVLDEDDREYHDHQLEMFHRLRP